MTSRRLKRAVHLVAALPLLAPMAVQAAGAAGDGTIRLAQLSPAEIEAKKKAEQGKQRGNQNQGPNQGQGAGQGRGQGGRFAICEHRKHGRPVSAIWRLWKSAIIR